MSRVNSILGLVIAVLVVGYVMQTNALASQGWRLRQGQARLASLLEQRNALVAEESKLDDRSVLQALALGQGMIPAASVAYLVQDTSVAAR